jgi:hypothetical protein
MRDKPVVVYGRSSSDEQKRKGNLDDQIADGKRQLRQLGATVINEFSGVEHSNIRSNRLTLERAIFYARDHGAVVVAVSRDRFLRCSTFNPRCGRNDDTPTYAEMRKLAQMAGGVTLATMEHPDAPAGEVRSQQIKRGHEAKDAEPGRPRAHKPYKQRRLAWLSDAQRLSDEGLSSRQIAEWLSVNRNGFPKVSHMTISRWLKRCNTF